MTIEKYLVLLLGVLLVLIGRAIVIWNRRRWRRRTTQLPPPDDPRLRNVMGIMEWKAKRRALKCGWNA